MITDYKKMITDFKKDLIVQQLIPCKNPDCTNEIKPFVRGQRRKFCCAKCNRIVNNFQIKKGKRS